MLSIHRIPHDQATQKFDLANWEWVNRPWVAAAEHAVPVGDGERGGVISGIGGTEDNAIADARGNLGNVPLGTLPCGERLAKILSVYGGDPRNWPPSYSWDIDEFGVGRLKTPSS